MGDRENRQSQTSEAWEHTKPSSSLCGNIGQGPGPIGLTTARLTNKPRHDSHIEGQHLPQCLSPTGKIQ